MRKSYISGDARSEQWLEVASIAAVEVSSESLQYPIDNLFETGGEWRAGTPGPQSVRIYFDSPQRVRLIRLRFVENARARTQEFVLSWAPDTSGALREIVRQQWNFSPDGSTEEIGNYNVDLPAAAMLRLDLTPDISGGDAFASLAEFRIG